mgnify:CR=1 FL=1
MEMTMKTRKELTKALAKRYKKATKNAKSLMLGEFCASTGYNRDYAASILRNGTKPQQKPKIPVKRHAGRPPVYDDEFAHILESIWRRFDHLCGKRFIVLLKSILPSIRSSKNPAMTDEQYEHLQSISAATVDRILAPIRKRLKLRGNSYTRPSNALKASIPVRTFGDWQNVAPGHFQIDTVGHDGGMIDANCAFTLCVTDVCLGWTERYAMVNRAFKWVKQGLSVMQNSIPFEILHLHPDGGSEFMNFGMIAWCKERTIELSRSRPGKKNDNCHVEQKNFDTIRKLIGYARYSTPQMIDTLNQLFAVHGLLLNYFYPSQKLIFKERHGSKIKKVYDEPLSPAQRLLRHPDISLKVKSAVRAKLRTLDPLELSNEVDRLVNSLLEQLAEQSNSMLQHSGNG